uniref:Retrotransposon gag domain-containing protein n=1 Tax=Tanacetum cinerariifolium TaxID=118510 RepID=A0A6L2LIQ7_TANCI|nr:hypothetical protein [Tanacetum cinerariifolium]
MPPRRLKKKFVKRLVEKRVAKEIEEYEKTKANMDNIGSSGGNSENVGGTVEQVFEICKCAEEDKVMFAASTFEGCTLTWWNRNVHTLGIVNANHIPWSEFKTMMTIEYCLTTEIQRIEQELWTLTLKEDDIEAYNNRIKGNITSLRPTTLHDAINMACELFEQAMQGLCPPRCSNCHKLGHEEEDYQTRIHVATRNSLQNVTCFGYKEKRHYRDKCLRGRNPQNKSAHGRAYVMRTEEPQQDPNIIVGMS